MGGLVLLSAQEEWIVGVPIPRGRVGDGFCREGVQVYTVRVRSRLDSSPRDPSSQNRPQGRSLSKGGRFDGLPKRPSRRLDPPSSRG